MTKQLYFLRDTRSTVGNSVVWWAHNDRGYTCDIRRAKIFTQKQVDELIDRGSDVPYPIDRILPLVQHHIDFQDLSDEGRVMPHTLCMKHIMK